MVIKQLFLKHRGGLYTYRVHDKKLDIVYLPEFWGQIKGGKTNKRKD